MGIILTVLAAIVVAFAVFLWLRSPGTVRPVLDAAGDPVPGSIAEKVFVTINGVEQGMFIRSADLRHPVLLFLHGGPGMPTYVLEQRYPTGLEQDFTVVWWEQRGAGLSYSPDIPPETMTVDQMVADTVALADHLRDRFGKEKIYLMGHSWGSFIGIQAAEQAPDRFHAYIGVGQLTNQLESERLAYDYMLAAFRAQGNADMVRKLEAAPYEATIPLPGAYMALRDAAIHTAGIGTTRDMRSVISGIFVPSWLDPEYTLQEKLGIWRGKWSSSSVQLWNEVLKTDIRVEVPKLDVPVYFLHGRHDYTTSYALAKAYLQQLEAPVKGFYTFEESAHSPNFEEPERTRAILISDVLAGAADLRVVE
ncbi:alpha/beta fold hydrolase [Tabrizicola sp.]|uniref:alpha/beta fold hydrolase n=1 Tax=Tabrizicola sp. TaxID=2005166 RepID=UPI003F2EBFE3